MPPIRVALAQVAPRLGDLRANLDRHTTLIEEARAGGADLVVFPELGLTGYLLQDLNAEVAMRLDDPRLARLADGARGISVIVSFVEESDDHRLFIAAALLEDGGIRHVHRKVYLPTYGQFDERRFFAAGSVFRPPTAAGDPAGDRGGEDWWHLAAPNLLRSTAPRCSSTSRPRPSGRAGAIGTAWHRRLMALAQPGVRAAHHDYVIFVNGSGSTSRSASGRQRVVGPSGASVCRAPCTRTDCSPR